MNVSERIYRKVQRLPEPLAQEVLDFAIYLESKHGQSQDIELRAGQESVMQSIWDNDADEIWNDA